MKWPDRETCLTILGQNKVPDHIRLHCLRVAQVAWVLAKALNENGLSLNHRLVFASSLLHDITKMEAITNGQDHAMTGCRLLEALGYPEVGDLIRQHVYLDEPENPEITEALVLNYADKRVLHTNVVTLEERFEDLIVRYGHTYQRRLRIKKGLVWALKVEKRIFSLINSSPETLLFLNRYTPDHKQEEIPWHIS